MAQKVQVIKTMADDLDGTEWNPDDESAGRTVEFTWGGRGYAIDLKAGNADEFEKLMARYVEHARQTAVARHGARATGSRSTSSSRHRGGGQSMGRSKEELAEIRAWARANGHEVADSGLIPKRIVEAWEQRGSMPEPIPGTQASVRPAGKAPAKAAEPKEPAKVSPLDALIPPLSQPVFRGSDNR